MRIDSGGGIIGTPVVSSDGHPLGRVTTVHMAYGDDTPVLAQVARPGERHEYVVPLLDAASDGTAIVLPYDRATVVSQPVVTGPARLSLGEAALVLERYGAGAVDLAGRRLDERVTDAKDVADDEPDVERLPPVVIIRPGNVPLRLGRVHG
jgi:hypothetical protein